MDYRSISIGTTADGALWFQAWLDNGKLAKKGKASGVEQALQALGLASPAPVAPVAAIVAPVAPVAPVDWQALATGEGWMAPAMALELLALLADAQAALANERDKLALLQACPIVPVEQVPTQEPTAPVQATPKAPKAPKFARYSTVTDGPSDPVADYLQTVRLSK